jgi:murein L,D-transpeptidase YafK
MDKYYMRSKLAAGKLFAGFVLIASLLASNGNAADQSVRVEVNTSEMSLTVWKGNKAVRHYPNIAIGSGGVSAVHYQGDESTPLGEYTVLWINRDSSFDNFVGLNYPTEQHADLAFKAGKLSLEDYRRIAIATRYHSTPPFNTPLGGRIGIHGIGHGSRDVHELINWTNGCVALTNEEMRELMQWIHVGTRVTIRR